MNDMKNFSYYFYQSTFLFIHCIKFDRIEKNLFFTLCTTYAYGMYYDNFSFCNQLLIFSQHAIVVGPDQQVTNLYYYSNMLISNHRTCYCGVANVPMCLSGDIFEELLGIDCTPYTS